MKNKECHPDWLYASIVLNFVLFIIIMTLAVSISQSEYTYRQERTKLLRENHNLDSILTEQQQLIMTLTYQHEDDDALMEEEQP